MGLRLLVIFGLFLSGLAFSQELVEDNWSEYPEQKQLSGQIVFHDTIVALEEFSQDKCRKEFRLGEAIFVRPFTETSIGNYYRLAHYEGNYPTADWGVRGAETPISISKAKSAFKIFINDQLIGIVSADWYAATNKDGIDRWTSFVLPMFPSFEKGYFSYRNLHEPFFGWVYSAEPGDYKITIEYVLTDNQSTSFIGIISRGEFLLSFNEKERQKFLESESMRTLSSSRQKNLEFPENKISNGGQTVKCAFHSPSSVISYYFFDEELIALYAGYMLTRDFPIGTQIYRSINGKRGEMVSSVKPSHHMKAYVLPGMGLDRTRHIRDLPMLQNVKENGLTGGVSLTKTSAAGDKEKPLIKIINPTISSDLFQTEEKFLQLEVEVTDNKQVFEVLVNGQELVPIAGGSRYAVEVPLGYGENEIQILAKDVSNNKAETVIKIERAAAGGGKKTIGRNGTDYALVFATNDYDHWNDLKNPLNDGKTVADDLEKTYGFRTEVVENPSLDDFYSVIKTYGKKVYKPGDQLFIFITGHGFYDDVFKEGYLVMKDSEKPDDDPGRRTYIAHSTLKTILDNNSCEHIMLVLDACFSGAFESTSHKGDDAAEATMARSEFIRQKLQRKSRKFFTSGGKEYVSDGKAGSHSPFAYRFINALRTEGGEDKVLTFNEIKIQIEKAKPMPRSGGFGSDAPGSDFIFIKRR